MKISKLALFGFFSLPLLSAEGQATRPRFEFRGLQFGDSVPPSKGMFRGNGLFCGPDKVVPTVQSCLEESGFKVAGVAMSAPLRRYLDRRLYTIYTTFDADSYSEVAEALAAKYGSPDTTWTEEVHSRMGASFQNETRRWSFTDGLLEVERYGDDLTTGTVYAASNSGITEYETRRKKAAAEAAASDLGPPVRH